MIENTVASIVYTADGAQTQWTIPFAYGHVEDVKLFVKVGTADIAPVASNLYSVDTELNTITYPLSGDPLAANDKVIVMRVTEQTQEESSVLLSFKSEDIERMADKLTMEVQELQEQLSRCIAYNPVDAAEGELDAQQYIDDLTDLKNTATSAAATATEQAGLASAAKTAAETAQDKAEKWAEGTDAQVAALGGTHSAEGWAGVAQAAAESEAVQTVAENIEDVNTVAGIQSDVTQVASIATAVSNVSDHDTEVNTVYDNLSSVITTATNINDVNAVAGIKNDVVAVSNIKANVTSVAGNASNINAVAANATNINAVNANKTNIDAVAGNNTNITAVAGNATNINAVNANKGNIDTVAGISSNITSVASNATNINTVATNISDIGTVAGISTDVSAVAGVAANISAVAADLTNIDTVATNISDVSATGQAIEDVSAVADNLTDISLVANDLENIDEVATKVAEWQKPADWPNIRSSANWNSAIFLVGHKADYSKYPSFTMKAQVSNSGTYDVFVDGIKQATTASGTATTLTWQTLSLTSGYDVTYPEALRTHIVRIAPSLGTNTITRLEGNVSNKGTLWAHITATNAIHYEYTFKDNAALEAVTTPTGELLVDWYPGIFQNCTSLKINPVINCTTSGNYYDTFAFRNTRVKKITIKNATINYSTDAFRENPNLEEVELINSKMQFDDRSFNSCHKLKNIPQIWLVGNHFLRFINPGLTGLENTFLDFSLDTGYVNRIDVSGTSTNRVDGLKGLVVSPSSPLADSSSPQINISYTGLDRAALVNLFNSMPTVTNSQVCNITGATGAADLTAEDLAIATNKGWTVTR